MACMLLKGQTTAARRHLSCATGGRRRPTGDHEDAMGDERLDTGALGWTWDGDAAAEEDQESAPDSGVPAFLSFRSLAACSPDGIELETLLDRTAR
jgi:hypothetical protein